MLITIKNIIGAIRNVLGIVTDGLKMWLPFERSDMVSSIQVTPDTSGNSNNATLYTGKALSFDGVNDDVDVGDTGSNANTIAITFVLDSEITHSDTGVCLTNLTGTGFSGIFLGAFTGTLTNELITIVDGSSVKNSYETTTDSISAGVHRLVMVYNSTSSNYDIYLDGVQKTLTSSPSMQPIPADNILLGRRADGVAHWFEGKLSDVQIYNTAWTQADVTYDYNKPNHLVTDNPSTSIALSNLKGYWALSEGAGSISYDSSGEGNNGTINGATYVDKQSTIPQLGMMDWAKSTPVSDEITLIADPNNPSQDILGNSVRLREHSFNLSGSGYAEVADDSSLDMSSGFSVDFWVKLNSNERQWLVTKGTAANTYASDLGFGTTFLNNIIYATVNTSVAKYQVGTTALSASGQWIYVCVSYEDNTTNGLKLYINQDSPIETTPSGTIDETHNLVIGSNYLKGSFFASNQIDSVRFYNRPLSSDEVEQNYKVGEVSHKVGSSFSDDFSGDYGN